MNVRRWWLLGTGLVLALAARVCYLTIRFKDAIGLVKRPHIESAALLFPVAGLVVRFATDALSSRSSPARLQIALWLAVLAGALALYWPALHIGLLSDDFILVQHARAWDISQVAPQLFRPLPIFVWAIVVHAGGGPATLHLLNILVHATNAYLAGRVVAGWVPERWWPSAASLFVLAAPLGPEAVAWCSGIFDVLATFWMLCAVLIARRANPGWQDHVLLIAVSIAALLSKETAIVFPLLLAIDAGVRRSLGRAFFVNTTAVTVFAAVFALIRLRSATAVETSGFTRYRVQRLVFDSFGALAAPWHVNDSWFTVVRTGYALCVIVLIAAFFVNRGPRRASAAVAGGASWTLASLLPLLAFFYVGPQLEGSRYLYLAACGWAAILVAAAADVAGRLPRADAPLRAVLVALIAIGAWGVRQHVRPWMHAAAVRDIVLAAAAADPRLHACSPAYVEGLPDSVDGAYLFANGAREALADVGVSAFARPGSGNCAFRWDPNTATFISVTGTAP